MESSVRKTAISNVTGLAVGERSGVWVVKDGETWRELTLVESDTVVLEYDKLYKDSLVPKSITMRQARLALHSAGLLSAISTSITSMPMDVQIEWEYANEILRASPTIIALATALNMSSTQVDELFINGAKL
jgi:hypothetical protein